MKRAWLIGLCLLLAWAGAVRSETQVAIVRSDWRELIHPVSKDKALNREEIESIVRKALDELGGMSRFVRPEHKWVVIKPNIVTISIQGSGDITDVRVVWAVARLAHEANPKARITIAEGSPAFVSPGHPEAQNVGPVMDGFAAAGYRAILEDPFFKDGEIDIVDLNFDEMEEVSLPFHNAMKTFWLPKTVRDCDVFIDVPVLKVINLIGLTCAMKNMVGIAPGMKYGWAKDLGYPRGSDIRLPHEPGLIEEMIVDIVSVSRINLVVVDAIVGLERNRTVGSGGLPRRLNTIVAGADPVAVDAVCARLVGFNPDDFEFITLADRQGIGVGDLSKITLKGQPLEEVETRFEKKPAEWGDERAYYGQSNRVWILKGVFDVKDKNRWRPDAKTLRPVPEEDGWSQPVYFHDDLIDLKAYYKRPGRCVSYAYAEFSAPKRQDAELWVGSSGGMTVWLNGKRVCTNEKVRRARLPNDIVPVKVTEGVNRLLVEVERVGRQYAFALNICEPEKDPRYSGNRIQGLKFHIPGVREAERVAAAVDSSNLETGTEQLYLAGWHTKNRFPGAIVRTFTEEDSLPRGRVQEIALGPDGTLWAMSETGGLMRYDGHRWWRTPLRGLPKEIWTRGMLVDHEGYVWIATNRGLFKAVGDSAITQPGRWIRGLCQAPDGTLYTASWQGVGCLKEGEWQALVGLPKDLVSAGAGAVGVGPDGSLWLGFRGSGVARYDGKTWRRWTTKTGLGDNHVTGIYIGPEGQVALEFNGAGVGWYDGRSWRFFDEEDGLLGRSVDGMAIDREGNLWVTGWASGQSGLSRFDGKRWATAVLSRWANVSVVDKEGNLWLRTGDDISIFSPKGQGEMLEAP